MRLLRCSLVLLAATGSCAAALCLLLPCVVDRAAGFEGTLVGGCAAVAAACTAWAWVCAASVVVDALTASGSAPAPARWGVPSALRRLVLAGCGVALSATAGPALATPGLDSQQGLPAVVAGLPFPARAMDLPAETHRVVVVRPGDSLWAIAARQLARGASDADITAGWRELYTDNRAVIGDDPSLIRPGQQLVLPDHLEESS